MAVSAKSSKRLVRNPNTPTLKSQGAGYSTTNRKGETTFYKSGKDAPGYNDTTQSRGDMSKGNAPISKINAGGNVITSADMASSSLITLPKKPPVTDMTSTTNGINSALANGSQGGYTYDAKSGFVTTPVVKQDTATDTFNSYMQAQAGNEANRFNAVDETRKMQKEMRPLENQVNSFQNQITAITQKRDQEQLALEGQGRGVTESIIGGQQAQIGREAFINAAPIQTQLAIAQGDLESARSYASQMFTAKAQDAQARYQYEGTKINAIYGFLTGKEKTIADEKKFQQSRTWQVEDRNINMANNLAQTAMEFGQSSLAGKFMSLDEKSPTFQKDLALLQGQVRKPVAASSVKTPDTQNFGSAETPDWRQYNATTGAWDEVAGVGGGSNGTLSKGQKVKISDSIVANKELDGLITEYKTLLDDVGFEGSTIGGENLGTFKALKSRMTTTLKKAETLGTLDAGVIQLINDLVGELPEKGKAGQNWFGFQSRGISSQLKKQSELINAKITADQQRLQEVSFDISQFDDTDDLSDIDAIFGLSASTQSSSFSADDWLN